MGMGMISSAGNGGGNLKALGVHSSCSDFLPLISDKFRSWLHIFITDIFYFVRLVLRSRGVVSTLQIMDLFVI